MKKLITILIAALCINVGIGQTIQPRASSNVTVADQNLTAINSFSIPRFQDTTAANAARSLDSSAKLIFTYDVNGVWVRLNNPRKWSLVANQNTLASTISILNDSSISICNSNSCDTFKFTNIVVNNFSVVNDSTIIVCDGNNTCDTLHIAPIQIAKSYVDSVKVDGSLVYYYINGNNVLAGVLGSKDGLISGGQVIWSGQGLKFYVSPATYIINQKFYSSPLDSVTLDPASAFSRVDLFIADTSSHAGKITGVADGNLLTPQVDPSSQIALTTGLQINPGDVIPASVTVDIVYSENVTPPDWTHGTQGAAMNIDFGNTSQPYAGTKDIFVSQYHNGSTPYFISPVLYPITTDATLSFWIYLKTKFKNDIWAELYDVNTRAVAWLRITPYINVNDTDKYQLVAVPLSGFSWSGNYSGSFERVLFNLTGTDTTGTGGFYLDNIQFQKGINSVPSPTDYSLKVDSVTVKKITFGSDTANVTVNWIKGVPYAKKDTIWTNSSGTDTSHKVYPIYVVDPIKAVNDTTIGFNSLKLPELRYSQTSRDTSNWKDSTLIDKKYLNDRIAEIGGGGITGNYVDTLTNPDSSTIRFHFAHGDYVDEIITGVDTSHLNDRINANAANIAANTAAIAGKADKSTTITINGITYDLSADRTWTISSGGGSSGGSADSLKKLPVDTSANVTGNLLAFNAATHKWYLTTPPTGGGGSVVDTTGTLNTIHNNKGFLVADTTYSGNHNSPYLAMSGRANGSKTFWATYVNGGLTKGIWNLGYSADSGATFTTLLSTFYNGTWSLTGTLAATGLITAPQFGAGTKFNVAGSTGQMALGQNGFNPKSSFIIADTTKGFIPNRGSTYASRLLTSNVANGTITNGGTGYTNTSNAPRIFVGSRGQSFTANATISGGVLTSLPPTSFIGYGARIGDVLSCTNCGSGTGMAYTVTALTGDTARGLIYYDSTLNQNLVWNGQAYSHEVDYLIGDYPLLHGPDYIFTGSAATLTLPSVSASHVGDGNTISIMNMGTGSITLNSDTGNTIVLTGSTTATNTITITVGSTVKLFPTGTIFKVLYNN